MPMSHELLFSAKVNPPGPPKMATAEQMASLFPDSGEVRKHRPTPRAPVPLQTYTIEYGVPARQFPPEVQGIGPAQIEFAAAAYDTEGVLLNGHVGYAALSNEVNGKYYRANQEFDVPITAAWICLAVRDVATGRIGNVEFPLPLPPETAKTTGTD